MVPPTMVRILDGHPKYLLQRRSRFLKPPPGTLESIGLCHANPSYPTLGMFFNVRTEIYSFVVIDHVTINHSDMREGT